MALVLEFGVFRAAYPHFFPKQSQEGHTMTDLPHTAGGIHNHRRFPLLRHSGTKHILHTTVWNGQGLDGDRAQDLGTHLSVTQF